MTDSGNFFGGWDTEGEEPEEEVQPKKQIAPVPPEPIAPQPAAPIERRRLDIAQIRTPFETSLQQKEILQAAMVDSALYGADAAAMICKGEQCPIYKKCPLVTAKIPLPLDESCPYERALMQTWSQAFMAELEIDPFDPSTVFDSTVAMQLAGLRLLVQRAMMGMAEDPKLMKVITTENDKFSNTVVTGNLNADYMLKAVDIARKLGQEAILSRKAKAALLKGGFKDKSKQAAELRERVQQSIAERKRSVKVDENGVPIELTEITTFERDKS